ncbi:MAG: hypothetical protein M3394_04840, partial [Actinomycetota bacterium]|nr:hypothetical protein [Actinomycetota bacterium]
AMSPSFSNGDPRILVAGTNEDPLPRQYRDDTGRIEPLDLPLPTGALVRGFAFASDYATSGVVFVSALHVRPQLAGDFHWFEQVVYRCGPERCTSVLDDAGENAFALVTVGGPHPALYAWDEDSVHRADEHGSFVELGPPIRRSGELLEGLAAGTEGRLLARTSSTTSTASGLYVSDDHGTTWRSVPNPDGWWLDGVLVLP